jgi:tetratricopeptide (TPR) repeat protein
MSTKTVIALALFIVFCAGTSFADKDLQATTITPGKETTLDLAAKYIKKYESKLDFKTQEDIKTIRTTLELHQGAKFDFDHTINDLVNVLTLKLAGKKDIKAIMVAAAILVQNAPESPRTVNLFGAVLHTLENYDDAVMVLRSILILTPDSELIKLNLATVYEDMGKWEDAKSVAESVISKNPDCMAAHKVLAHYYYSKKDFTFFGNELLKASTFKGYVIGKLDPKKHKNKIKKEMEKAKDDSVEALEKKVVKVREADVVPYTTADILDEEFPKEAKQIRDKYTVLFDNEQFMLPKLPQVKVNDLLSYNKNMPIIGAWGSVFSEKMEKFTMDEAASMGIDVKASDDVKAAQAEAAARKKEAAALQDAQDALKYVQNMQGLNGTDKAALNDAMKNLKSTSREQGITLKDDGTVKETMPGIDSGSLIVLKNYSDYSKISALYEAWLFKYFRMKYPADIADIYTPYLKKVAQEDTFNGQRLAEIETKNWGEIPRKKEEIRHKKKINELGLESYLRWVNYYMPEYTQKMKPTLDAYYKTCMLYIKNMNNPQVMEREYWRVRKFHIFYALEAGTHILDGGVFQYLGPTDAEEEELRQAMKKAEEAAKDEKTKYQAEFKSPDFDIFKWAEDHMVLEVSCEFLTLKINSKSIEFEAWAFGPDAGIKYDWTTQTMETYTGYGPKFQIGVNVAGLEIGAEGKFDIIRKTTKWDFTNGTYEESYGSKGEVKVKAADLLAAGGEMSINSQLEAKISGKIAVEGAGYIEAETDLK